MGPRLRIGVKYDFHKISQDSKVVIYGAGEVGEFIYKTLKSIGKGNIINFSDKNAEKLKSFLGLEVLVPSVLINLDFDYIFLGSMEYDRQMSEALIGLNIPDDKILSPLPLEYPDTFGYSDVLSLLNK